MPVFSVMIQVEADTLADAEALVAQWTVTPGAVLLPISGSVGSTFPPTTIGDGGVVGDALNVGTEDD